MPEARAKALAVVPPDAFDVAVGALNREQRRSRRKREVRARTVSVKRMTKRELEQGRLLNPVEAYQRPATRGECDQVVRPCPFVSCKHHLFLDVSEKTGAIKLNFPDLEPDELAESCCLDVADEGGTTLEQAGVLLNITRERVRQVEVKAFRLLRQLNHAEYSDCAADGERVPVRAREEPHE